MWMNKTGSSPPIPEWIKEGLSNRLALGEIVSIIDEFSLSTVCQEARCPNIGKCFREGTATFLIMGKICTRGCTFCAIDKGTPMPLDPLEPDRIADAVLRMHLKYVVITSVTRDDLEDGGVGHYLAVIDKLCKRVKGVNIEVLVPDFGGNMEGVERIVHSGICVFNHNVETVSRLYGEVRRGANYALSLEVLRRAKEVCERVVVKSGFMVGLGEGEDEVISLMEDLRDVGVDVLTIGQYLRPSSRHYPVVEYVHPDVFDRYKEIGEQMGFSVVYSAPFVRRSFKAKEAYERILTLRGGEPSCRSS